MKTVLLPTGVLCLLLAAFSLGPQIEIDTTIHPISVPGNLDIYLARAEEQIEDIIPGAEKVIYWAAETGEQTEISVVYLHGLSATRQEIAPFSDRLADSLGANLYYTRLSGHGRTSEALARATANDWLNDAKEAIEIGRRIGRRVLIVGTSTGATLATWLAATPDTAHVLGVILVSPNYGPANPAARVLLWPWGLQIAHLVQGDTHRFEPANDRQARFWTTAYPTSVLVQMMALVNLVQNSSLDSVTVPVLAFYSPDDRVVDVSAIKAGLARINTPVVVREVTGSGDASQHVIIGDILSPETTDPLVQESLSFVRAILHDEPVRPYSPDSPDNLK